MRVRWAPPENDRDRMKRLLQNRMNRKQVCSQRCRRWVTQPRSCTQSGKPGGGQMSSVILTAPINGEYLLLPKKGGKGWTGDKVCHSSWRIASTRSQYPRFSDLGSGTHLFPLSVVLMKRSLSIELAYFGSIRFSSRWTKAHICRPSTFPRIPWVVWPCMH